MNKITFLPYIVDKISDIISENNVVAPITLIQEEEDHLFMEFEIELHERWATARIELWSPEIQEWDTGN